MVEVASRSGHPRAGEGIAAGAAQQNQAGRPAVVHRVRARAGGAPGLIGASLMNRAARRIGLARVRHPLAAAIQRRWLSRAENGGQFWPDMPYVQRDRFGVSRAPGNDDPLRRQPATHFEVHSNSARRDWTAVSRPPVSPIRQPGPATPTRQGAQPGVLPGVLPGARRKATPRQEPSTAIGSAPTDVQALLEAGARPQSLGASPLAAGESQTGERSGTLPPARLHSVPQMQPARPQPEPPTPGGQNSPRFNTRTASLPVRSLDPQPALRSVMMRPLPSAGRLGQAIARQYARPAISVLSGRGTLTGPPVTPSLAFLKRTGYLPAHAQVGDARQATGDGSSPIAASRTPGLAGATWGHSGPAAPAAGTASLTVANRLPIVAAEHSPTAITRRPIRGRTQLARMANAGAGDLTAARPQALAQTGARNAPALQVDNQAPARVFAKSASTGPTMPIATGPTALAGPVTPGTSMISARSLPVEGEPAVGRPNSPRAAAVRRQTGRPVATVLRGMLSGAAGAVRFAPLVGQPVLRHLHRGSESPHRAMPAARDEATVMHQLSGTASAPGSQPVLRLATMRPMHPGAAPVVHATVTRAGAAQGSTGASSMQPASGLRHAPSILAVVESNPTATRRGARLVMSARLSTSPMSSQVAVGARAMQPRATPSQPLRLARGGVATSLRRAAARGDHTGADNLGSWIVQRLQSGSDTSVDPLGGAFPGHQFDEQQPLGAQGTAAKAEAAADAVGGLVAQPLLTRHAAIAHRTQLVAMPGSEPNAPRPNDSPTPDAGAQNRLARLTTGGAGARSPLQATPLLPAPDLLLARPAAGPVNDSDTPRQTQEAAFDGPIGAAIQRAAAHGSAGPVANHAPVTDPTPQSNLGGAGAALNQLDLERVAREVYTLIERRLVFEREVMGL